MRNHLVRRFVALLSGLLLFAAVVAGCRNPPGPPPDETGGKGERTVFFCFWNAENFFDDQDDKRKGPGDKEYDPWFANHPEVLKLKLEKLTEALLKMNDRKGPDIIALVEVESVRAGELLKDALNAKLDKSLAYTSVVMREVKVGRHIAPCVITRLPVEADRTQQLDKKMRILKMHVIVNDRELVLFVTHFTSRLSGGKERRAEYGNKIYGAYRAMVTNNPKVDVLVCGDFNDGPDDVSIVQHLHAVGDRAAVLKSGDEPKLFNLMAGKDAKEYGTYYEGHWDMFDQIMVSPGMLDRQGWWCDEASVRPFKETARPKDRLGRPWRFGNPNDMAPRGYSDHFPVTLRLHVQGG